MCAVLKFMHSILYTAAAVEVGILLEMLFCVHTEYLGKQKIYAKCVLHTINVI